jgi:DNA repair exonuclease SbcCD ATPase subunit
MQSDALEHLASSLQDAQEQFRCRHQERRASIDLAPQAPVAPAITDMASSSGDTGSVPLKYIILEAEVEKLKEDLMREQRKTARYEKQIESILSQHNEELMRMSMQVEELKEQLAHTHRRLARSQEKLTESEEGLLIKTIHAKELIIESLQASGM